MQVKGNYMRKIAISVLGFLLMIGGCDNSVIKENSLHVTYQQQLTQSWCWAATIQMVCDYYTRPVQQCQIVGAFLNYDCCFDPFSCSGRTGQLYEIQQALYATGLTSTQAGPLTFDQIQSEIDGGRPIIIAYLGSFSGHVVVIYGYKQIQHKFLGIFNTDVESLVYVDDPYFGQFQPDYGNTFTYSGHLVWTNSIYQIRPLVSAAN